MAADLRELREDYAAGRLTLDEFAARVGASLRNDREPDALGGHLASGEHVLWSGRPDAARHFSRADLVAVPFSLVWAGFALFWEITVIASGAPIFFPLFGAVFVLIGLYMTVGRFARRWYRRRRTRYAVTNRRVLKLERRGATEHVESAFLAALGAVTSSLRRDGSGTVEFGADAPVFEESREAGHVAELVTRLLQERPDR